MGRSLLEVLPGNVLVAPYLVTAGTDARFYADRSEAVFRFLPVLAGPDVLSRVHGTNERVSVESLEIAVRYFIQLIRNTDQLP